MNVDRRSDPNPKPAILVWPVRYASRPRIYVSCSSYYLKTEIENLRKRLLEETPTTMAQDNFPALPGIYRVLFLYLEPSKPRYLPAFNGLNIALTVSTMIAPVIMVWLFPGASWFHHQLIPSAIPVPTASLEPRTLMLLRQLTNCRYIEHKIVIILSY